MTSPLATISPLVQRLRLARIIEQLRVDAGLTQAGLATAIGEARQAVTRLENPLTNLERRISSKHILKILKACGVKYADPRYRDTVELIRAADADGWWKCDHPHMGARQQVVANIELGASLIREYHPYLPPGLAQTEAYARGVSRQEHLDGATPDGVVAGRLQRQQEAFECGAIRYQLVLEEMVVRRPMVAPDILREQLLHLIKLAERPGVSVRILTVDAPLGVGWAPTSPYSIYAYPNPEDPLVAVIDTVLQDHIVVDPQEVHVYAQLHDRLRDAALSDADSAAFIRNAADDLLATA
ncbi:helix-turn-helix domain-containing protein [Micromonospora fluostatini]|uniref:helix-turn-helix domain-containing protein n=1 Tax=Micromonospora sp. JCM 30529 TaxID=3421643 RepID=UPI003D1824F1